MSTQQEIIKQFMAALDTTSKTGTAAVDEAINLATNGKFKTAQEVINQMVSDCNSAGGADKFLSDYCGIILDNSDTGAITGKDAGGSAIKTAENIVPESGSLINFTGNSFTVNGLTVQLGRWVDYENTTSISFADLTDDQKFIWQSLYSYWAASALNLIEESYGYSFTDSDATVKEITLAFVNNSHSGESAATYYVDDDPSDGRIDTLVLTINTARYNNFADGDVNGISPSGQVYLDRTIAHQLTYAIMNAKIDYRYNLPMIITAGTAELTQGIDDVRTSELKKIAGDSNLLKQILRLDAEYNTVSGVTAPDYSGGYMFLRYLAKQAAEENSNIISLTSGADNYTNTVAGATIYALAGNDIISNTTIASAAVIFGGEDKDYIWNDGTSVIIYGGDGDDYIHSRSIYSTLNGGEGNDYISNSYVGWVIIDGGEGNDSIDNKGSYNLINGGIGDDTVINRGSNVTTNTGNGNDYIDNWGGDEVTIEAGVGNDFISNYQGYNIKINAGDGEDSIENHNGLRVKIDAGASADIISLYSDYSDYGNNTLAGGTGNDTIYLDSKTTVGNVYVYNSGDGADLIYNATSYDTVSIGGASYSTATTSGGDMIISVGSGAMTLVGASSISFKIIGDSVPVDPLPAGISISGATLTASTKFTGNSIDLADYASTVTKVNASALSRGISIAGTSAANSIKGGSGADTISGGAGNDTVSLGAGNDVYIYSGGNDVIQGYAAGDSISLASGSVSAYSISGSDAVFKIGSNTLKVKSGKGKEIVVNGKTYPTVDSKNVSLTSGNDSYTNTVTGATIYALAGNDTISNAGSLFNTSLVNGAVIYGGDGKDSILNEWGDSVKIDGGEGSDTIRNNYGDYVTIYGEEGNDYIINNGDNVTIDAGLGNDTISNGHTSNVKINSGEGADIILNDGSDTTIDAGAGNDWIYVISSSAKIDAGTGADRIEFFISSDFYSNNTISGGTGNDTIWLNRATTIGNVYVYNSGDGNDTIYNVTSYDTVSIGGASYSTTASDNNVIVSVGSGKMTFINAKDTTFTILPSIKPADIFTTGNDKYANTTANTVLSALAGNDSITNSASNVTIYGEAGNDTIKNSANKVYIDGGAGNDKISLGSSATGNTLIGGAGNDTIYSSGKGNIFLYDAGDGNDSISGSSANDTLKITGGTYTLSGSTVSVYSGDSTVASGKIIFKNTAPKIDGTPVPVPKYPKPLTSAADTLTVSDDNATVYGLAENDVLKISGNAGYFDGGAGNDKISLGSSATGNTLIGGAGNDTIYSSGKGNIFLYEAGDGNDSISGSSANDTLKITGGTYTLSGSTVSVYSGDSTVASGKIIFKNTAPQIIGSLKPVPVPEYPKSLTSAADTLTISDDNATVYALAGNDVLKISGNAGYFDGGAGNDKLSLGSSATGNTLIGGAGNDTIYSSGKGNIFLYEAGDGNDSISGSSANDTLKITGGTYTLSGSTVSVYSGDSTVASGRIIFKNTAPQIIGSLKPESGTETGVVTLTKNSDNHTNTVPGATISALAGADNIKNSANDVSISGEAGNDIISLGAAATNVTINGGAGNDKIYTNGNGNFIEYASGDGNDIIYGFAGEDLIQILSGTPIFAQSNADAIITVGKNSITLKNVDSDELSLDDNNKISLNKIIELTLKYNKNLVELPYERAIIHGSTSNDNYINLGNNVTLDGAAGNDTICNNQNDISISGAAGNDVISLGSSAQNVTIHGGAGADLIYTNGKNNSIQYDAGKDTVHGFGGSDSIQIAGTIKDSQQSGENVVVTVGSSSNILKIVGVNIGDLKYEDGAITYDINEISLTGGDDTKTIDEDKSRVHALGGNDVITNTANEVTIYGGAGKDKITSNGRSTWLDGGEGNDTIRLGEDSEMATITGGAGNDSISVSGGANLFIYEEGDGNDTIVGFSKGDSISVSAEKISEPLKNSNVTFEIGAGKIVLRDVADEEFTVENNIIMLKDVSRRQTIPGTDKADPLENNAVGVIIDALGGIDTINNSGGSVTIYGGAGNDKIFNAGNEAYIDGGAGADLISLASGVESATIFGGAGNDTIYSSGKGTLIQYGTGGSKDVIVGFGGSDSIEIVSGTIRNYKADGDDVKVTVGTGTTNVLTLKDFALENFHVEGNLIYSSGRSGSNGLFFDDNFIGGDTQLDSIVEKNFTVTNLDADNFENLAQEKSLITYGEK